MATKTWMVTGGLGFIGSSFVRLVLRDRPDVNVINFDAMTYAGNPANVAEVNAHPRHCFVRGDICNAPEVAKAIGGTVDAIVNFAAETHVDRSILEPEAFLRTDILGTHVLLEAVRKARIGRFVQVSTDEVYGHVPNGSSQEGDPLAPSSPYAASKAGADLQALAYATTYGSPVVITRGSNTYGPYQYPEKLIPLFITKLLDNEKVPLYGDGLQVREWIHVEDHARAILHVLERGDDALIYNVGGGSAHTNLDITQRLIEMCGRSLETHVESVLDRPGHDRRYALNSSRLRDLGWEPRMDFANGLAATVTWYRQNHEWWRPIKDGEFAAFFERQYAGRSAR